MAKLIPFKCTFGHITIKLCNKPTVVQTTCMKCIDLVLDGKKRLRLGNAHTFGKEDIIARRF